VFASKIAVVDLKAIPALFGPIMLVSKIAKYLEMSNLSHKGLAL
jgi:hypothetical protein